MCQATDQFQFTRAPHGLAQARCQGTCLKIGTGQKTQYFESKHDKTQATVGSRNGEAEL